MGQFYSDAVDQFYIGFNSLPDVFANDVFAMKSGTAINLVVQDTPRLSVSG